MRRINCLKQRFNNHKTEKIKVISIESESESEKREIERASERERERERDVLEESAVGGGTRSTEGIAGVRRTTDTVYGGP